MKPIFWSLFVILTALNVHHVVSASPATGETPATDRVMASTPRVHHVQPRATSPKLNQT